MIKLYQEDRGDNVNKIKTKKKSREDIQKYVNFALAMIAIVLVVFIGCKLYDRYQNSKLKTSVFSGFVGSIQYDDISDVTGEMPTHGFILVSYVKNEKVNELESGLKKSVLNHELQSNFYYFNATDLMLNEGYIDDINEKFGLKDINAIQELPALLYYRDGKIMRTISSTKDRMLSTDDFDKLLDNYEIIGKEK